MGHLTSGLAQLLPLSRLQLSDLPGTQTRAVTHSLKAIQWLFVFLALKFKLLKMAFRGLQDTIVSPLSGLHITF